MKHISESMKVTGRTTAPTSVSCRLCGRSEEISGERVRVKLDALRRGNEVAKRIGCKPIAIDEIHTCDDCQRVEDAKRAIDSTASLLEAQQWVKLIRLAVSDKILRELWREIPRELKGEWGGMLMEEIQWRRGRFASAQKKEEGILK